jgi:choline dehydrogenase
VVGAGSAGCALAYQLARSGRRILLLEAGGSDRSAFIKIPTGTWRVRPHHDWGYRSQSDPTRNGVTDDWHRGRVLGGTSSINGMVYVRGAAGDFNRWARHCTDRGGWSAQELMPIFRELEHSDQISPWRGRSGRIYVRTVKRPHSITEAFVASACAAGYPFTADYNGENQEGVGYLQFTQRLGMRWSAADAFVRPILGQDNFQLRLHTLVEKIEVSGGRAVAVVFRHQGKLHRETARDIVLSAGAINSPKLLMLSGIGDPKELGRHNIDLVLNVPSVGQHLAEHPALALSYHSKIPTYNLTQGLLQKLGIAAKYLWHQEGPIAAAYEAAAFLKSSATAADPELQIFFAPIGWGKVSGANRLSPYPALKVVVLGSHPMSRGSIRLASNDPTAAPLIEGRLLEHETDVDLLVRGVETIRTIMNTRPIADLIAAETQPGPAIESAQALRQYVYCNAELTCHPIGTCRMGATAETVVDPDLRVRGTENLWIADASIMPDAISANINAVCMVIGAKLGKQLVAR